MPNRDVFSHMYMQLCLLVHQKQKLLAVWFCKVATYPQICPLFNKQLHVLYSCCCTSLQLHYSDTIPVLCSLFGHNVCTDPAVVAAGVATALCILWSICCVACICVVCFWRRKNAQGYYTLGKTAVNVRVHLHTLLRDAFVLLFC